MTFDEKSIKLQNINLIKISTSYYRHKTINLDLFVNRQFIEL